MKRLLPVSVLLLTGCGGMMSAPPTSSSQQANYERIPAAVANPSVLIVGDSIVNAWCSAALLAQNPRWACQGSPPGIRQETTTEVLARFPKAIAAHPKTIVIEAGTWDLNSISTNDGDQPTCSTTTNLCANIEAMITEATNAGIVVIVCTTPPWGAGSAATDNGSLEADLEHEKDINEFNVTIMAMAASNVIPIDMYALLAESVNDQQGDTSQLTDIYLPIYTDDGIDPNTAGGQVMTQALQKALSSVNAST
jgi:lysophospholipase L1-like esterase